MSSKIALKLILILTHPAIIGLKSQNTGKEWNRPGLNTLVFSKQTIVKYLNWFVVVIL